MLNYNFSLNVTLPIFKYKEKIIETIKNNQVTVIYGNTGCGKTSQIPLYILDAKLNNNRCIAVTQPWEIAVVNMANRVSEELKCACGMEVGYEIKSMNQSCESTKIKYTTDDCFVDLCVSDNCLSKYGIVMVDEAHERTVSSDVLLGILKSIIKTRTDLKVVITSAKIPTERFSTFFDHTPIIRLETYSYPVVPIFEPIRGNDFVDRAVNVVEKTLKNVNKGDYLIFLPGQAEIDSCYVHLSGIANICAIKLYESMDSMAEIFDNIPTNHRKVIITNDIGATLFTLPTVRYVIDCGVVRRTLYDCQNDCYVTKNKKITKFQADLRARRASCSNKGWCYRIYRQKVYDNFSEVPDPEIRHCDFSNLYMNILAMGLDIKTLELLDPPDPIMLKKCQEKVEDLLDESFSLEDVKSVRMDPLASKVVVLSLCYDFNIDVVTMMTMIRERNLFEESLSPNYLYDTAHKAFYDKDGDHFTMLNVYQEFVNNGKTKKWCYLNYLNYDVLVQIDKLRSELINATEEKRKTIEKLEASVDERLEITKLIMKVYFKNLCVKKEAGKYISYLTRRLLYVDPRSSLFKESPQLILYHECVQTEYHPVIYGILKVDEALLTNFPNEMEKIKYQTGEICEKSESFYGCSDPFEGDNDPEYVYVDYDENVYYESEDEWW